MEELKNNKMFWVLVVVTVFNVGAFLIGKVVVEKAAERAIQRLQKDYSPSPYGPGMDPDRVNLDAFNGAKQYYVTRRVEGSAVFRGEEVRTGDTPATKMAGSADRWRDGWEADRGVSPGQ